ncbi:CU044_5270 family protein [Paractinoplanes brasiliensis]|uniref:CU044_5270 family protein n=1 Tax=Paractinoplanes brasiliensis TaxID=52695 RepID=A0A4R6JX56_9ACTN|nr:CU044_5270 family protein [Actinoplanes brasiliensis]TDO40927.1 hypothetical protein C8E87_4648 [Actinoplanes brasiliensis]GID25994.1 hypothetical protein Abr02nite_09770 [Actinoplanes brasiliensis]
MNDLDLMEKFRADVPPPAPGVLANARSAMFRAEPARSRTRWVWRSAPVAALAVAVGVAGVVALPGEQAGPASSPQEQAPEAVRVLRLAAAEARRETPLKARSDQFVYVESRVAWAGAAANDKPSGSKRPAYQPPVEKLRRVWLSVDGSRAGLLSEPGEADWPLDAGQRAYRDELPTDARAMRAYLYRDTANAKGIPADRIAFVKVGDTLREQYLPPASVAALFEAAATIPGTTTVKQTDLAGRRGIAVSRVDQGTRHDLIFDATSYKFLGERDVVVDDTTPYPKNAVTGWTAQLKIAIVDRAGQLP